MKRTILSMISAWFLLFFGLACSSGEKNEEAQYDQPENWEIAVLAYTFRNNTFFEAVDKAHKLGVNYIGGYPGQTIGGELLGKMQHNMDEETKKNVLDYLASRNVKLVDFGVISPDTEEEWDKLFQFARDMGIENIVSEPDPDHLEFISKLCDDYQIKVAIHNHAAPSRYWNPDTLMNLLEDKNEMIGVCADVGHWVRSGLDPVESLKKVQERLFELHFKDVAKAEKSAPDVVWGTGVSGVKDMLDELLEQDFSGILAIEYESNPDDNMQEIEESLDFYHNALKR